MVVLPLVHPGSMSQELRTLSEQDHVWLVFNPQETVKLTYENAASADEATRTVSEDFAEAFATSRQWALEPGRDHEKIGGLDSSQERMLRRQPITIA